MHQNVLRVIRYKLADVHILETLDGLIVVHIVEIVPHSELPLKVETSGVNRAVVNKFRFCAN